MSTQTPEQAEHDKVNLFRLVRRLEKTVASSEWQADVSPSAKSPWLKTQGMLQNVKHARKLLRNVEAQGDLNGTTCEDIRKSIDHLERTVSDFEQRVAPKRTRPPPILPTLPLPVPKPKPTPPMSPKSSSGLPPVSLDPNSSLSEQDLLLSPSETTDVPSADASNPSIPPPPLPFPVYNAGPSAPSVSTVKGTPAFFQNSTALHEELSEQLAQMATQLKHNALHFAGSLENDKAVVLETQEKLGRNFDVLSNQRVRLRDHRTKSWGTTWITLLSIVVAIIGFMLTFFVIRFT